MRIPVPLMALLAVLTGSLLGESHDCINPSLVVTDGRIVTSQFEANNGTYPTYWYAFYGQAGHSYSVEFVPAIDNEANNQSIRFVNFTVWGPNDIGNLQQNGCRGTSSLSVTANQKYSPTLARDAYGAGQRVSLVQPTSGLDIVAISNSQGAGAYSYRIIDTTLFNPRWSTYSGFDSQWGFMNQSDMAITGTLSIYDAGNHLLKSVQISVPAGGEIFRSSGSTDLNLPRNNAGYCIFAHNGPPRAVLGDSYMLNGNATVVIYAKFESRYSQ